MQNNSTGTEGSSGAAVKLSNELRWPCWKIQTSAPNEAPIDRMFMMTAFKGSTTEPVSRNRTM